MRDDDLDDFGEMLGPDWFESMDQRLLLRATAHVYDALAAEGAEPDSDTWANPERFERLVLPRVRERWKQIYSGDEYWVFPWNERHAYRTWKHVVDFFNGREPDDDFPP